MGQPWALQNAASPGSSFFRSMLAAAQTAAGLRPDAAQNAAKASSSCWAVVPRRHPTPSTPMRGTRWSAPPCGVRVRAKSAASGASAFSTPAGASPATGHGDQYRTVCPASRAPLTRLMRSGSRTAQFWALAQRSTAKRPLTSVAVVMTGTAPHAFASARASALAPPRWPDRSGTAKFPPSSTTTTAGSAALLLQWGAMARTAMPTAPTKIRASSCAKCSAVQPFRVTSPPQRLTLPGRASASRWASASPFAVKARYARLTARPPSPAGTRW